MGSRFSSVPVIMSGVVVGGGGGGSKAPYFWIKKEDILSLVVHFTADKNDDHLLTAVNGPVMRAAYMINC